MSIASSHCDWRFKNARKQHTCSAHLQLLNVYWQHLVAACGDFWLLRVSSQNPKTHQRCAADLKLISESFEAASSVPFLFILTTSLACCQMLSANSTRLLPTPDAAF
eukprot:EG_transcript_24984